jgi:hypothetical protein
MFTFVISQSPSSASLLNRTANYMLYTEEKPPAEGIINNVITSVLKYIFMCMIVKYANYEVYV